MNIAITAKKIFAYQRETPTTSIMQPTKNSIFEHITQEDNVDGSSPPPNSNPLLYTTKTKARGTINQGQETLKVIYTNAVSLTNEMPGMLSFCNIYETDIVMNAETNPKFAM